MRLFLLSVLFSAIAFWGSGVVHAESDSPTTDTEPVRRDTERSYIHIKALHASLAGSYLYDSGCLLFRVNDCNVMALADEKGNVKLILATVDASVKKAKRRDELAVVKRQLRLLYCLPRQPHELLASTGDAAILYYDDVEEDVEMDAEEVLAMPRCEALMHMIAQSEISTLREVCGLACFFRIKFENVEMDFGVDLSYPSVNYVELRGVRIFRSKMKVNVEEEVADMFPSLTDDFSRDDAMFGKGSKRLRTLAADGTFYLGRNARFFAAGTSENLEKALKNGACYKTYGFESPSFAEWAVSLPAKLDAATLLTDPTAAPKEPTEREDVDAESDAFGGDAAGTDEPGAPAKPADPAPVAPAAPLTPEEARKAYQKLLREM